ncbi:MAG: hypothetical protein LBI04_03120 [Treponema sp.]|jgi:hypothetical protein|nr:hypothetical protein [Treponema sp.]
MGVIKTALEIALERTEKVKSDKSGIDLFEAKQRGKKTASAFLAGQANLDEEIKKTAQGQRESLKQGIFDVLISQIAMPSNKEDEKKLETAGKGLGAVINDKNFSIMFKKLMDFLAKYLQEAAQYDQAIRQQYAPKLRQKEEELSRRLGREVRIDPFQDPEFVAFYNQHMNALKNNYEGIIEQAKEESRRMFEAGNSEQ